MIAEAELRIAPAALDEPGAIERAAARALGVAPSSLGGCAVLRRSIDARRKPPVFALRVRVWIDEDMRLDPPRRFAARDVRHARPAIVVGSGPAGLFAALELVERGVKPIVLERGREVRGRRRDVARLCREGAIDPESNYCFGEGGAGTFSDGKLYTRSTKRGDVRRVLELLVEHGAPGDILIDAHPHVGTNRLPRVVEAIREAIVACGGEVRCEVRVVELLLDGGRFAGVVTADGERLLARAAILATGHSARDVYAILGRARLAVDPKPFAVGVRVEHRQDLIDRIQFGCAARPRGLPAASYSLTHQVGGRGVFSFCMCPGGIICPSATAADEVVVNGWSPSSRRCRWASSGIVAQVLPADLGGHAEHGVFAGVAFQAELELAAYRAGGGAQVAPAQRLLDFCRGVESRDLPPCSYRPGVMPADLRAVLPEGILAALRAGFARFGRALAGFATNDAVVVAVESRTSSPVRVPRHPELRMHPQAEGLFPCGEGAGWAGGILSAALDGVGSARALVRFYG